LSDDSRTVNPGEVFFARRGTRLDGRRFASEALGRGAIAVVAEEDAGPDVPTLPVPDVAAALRAAADALYGRPQAALRLVGVTGTKGKTTTAWLTAGGLRAAGHKVALLGTIGNDLGDGVLEPAQNTTPGPLALRRFLARARDGGCTDAVLEVSSHALHQERTEGIGFRAAVFTNLTSDHLDYHGTPEAYFRAKARLFEGLDEDATAVLNREASAWTRLLPLVRGSTLTYGTSAEADLRARDVRLGPDGTRFRLVVAGDGEVDLHTRLVGMHNVLNLLGAVGACAALGLDPVRAATGAAAVPLVPGRLERVGGEADLDAFVDYAHTEDALRQVLVFLRTVGARPVVLVVGCGGDRDRSKRPRMARVAFELSDDVVFTSDNPRSERPEAILADMTAGLDPAERERVTVIQDRRAAIRHAVDRAPPGATVLVAGKGHETWQVVDGAKVPFDDAAELRRALVRRGPTGPSGRSGPGGGSEGGGESWGASQA
jgi:UDP-N-acetylmuramoyl-L-alanyl-D-glutamate--2,6-diaminopimelate ligase